MKLIHRIGYYSLGLFFGIIILIFFLSGKKTSCDYLPNDRVLKNIRIKERKWTDESLSFFSKNAIDTSAVSYILEEGDVDFDKSKTQKEPCGIFVVSGKAEEKLLELQIENCDSIATLLKAGFKE
ncbi:hypothetical protein [Salegentibacter chungangensis]|uniref:DUF4258 domain-containing protein n=1 Tax=Salegentibacter chungangensis TaxID=1335724 RepID=A0ABW3NUL9_9FLAO